jgi:hypothetical protein
MKIVTKIPKNPLPRSKLCVDRGVRPRRHTKGGAGVSLAMNVTPYR